MASRLVPVALVIAALVADARGLHELAFYLLVAGVVAGAVCALSVFGDLVELPGSARGVLQLRLELVLAGVGLVCVLVAAAVRSRAADVASAPDTAVLALVAAVGVYALQAVAALVRPMPVLARTGPSRPARPGR